jgi:hypothetical protein
MLNRSNHRLERTNVYLSPPAKVENTGYPAHLSATVLVNTPNPRALGKPRPLTCARNLV